MDELERLFDQGVALYEEQRFEEAKAAFLQALKLDPTSDDVMYNLALACFALEEYDSVMALVSRIQTIDCEELLTAMQEADTDLPVALPDDIPDTCQECQLFTASAFRKKDQGFCGFYQMERAPGLHCHALDLAESGAVDPAEIEPRRNARLNAALQALRAWVDDPRLPARMACEGCGEALTLSETERQQRRVTCPDCGTFMDAAARLEALRDELTTEADEALFQRVTQPEAFRADYVLAAKKEIAARLATPSRADDWTRLLKDALAQGMEPESLTQA